MKLKSKNTNQRPPVKRIDQASLKTELNPNNTSKKYPTIQMVPISKIKIPENRQLMTDIASMVESVRTIGITTPITLKPDFTLIAGRHRIAAALEVGLKQIPALIMNISGIEAKIAEIDENLIRRTLSDLEQSESLLRRKRLFEKLGKVHKNGGDRKSTKIRMKKMQSDPVKSFSKDVHHKTGRSERTVYGDLSIATNITKEARDLIRGTKIANRKCDLKLLGKQDPDIQLKVARLIAGADVKTINEAIKEALPTPIKIDSPEFAKKLKDLEIIGKNIDLANETVSSLCNDSRKNKSIIRSQPSQILGQIDSLNAKTQKLSLGIQKMKNRFITIRKNKKVTKSNKGLKK